MHVPNYQYKGLKDAKDLADYKRAFDVNGSPKDIKKLQWVHFENPINETLVCLTYTGSTQLAAIYATMPVFFQINGKQVKACQSLDTLTDKQHRGKGLFTKSAAKVFEEAEQKGYELIYGFPNGNSVHGFVKKLDWKLLDPVPFLFKPLRTGYFLSKGIGEKLGRVLDVGISKTKKIKFPKGDKIIRLDSFNRETDAVWEVFSEKIAVSIQRDSQYLNWRYVDKPGEDYQIFGYYRNQQLFGFIVYTLKVKHKGNIGYIMELIMIPSEILAGKKLVQFALNALITKKADVCLAWCMEHTLSYSNFRKKGFKNLPNKLRPIELHLGYRAFGGDDSLLQERNNWYISYSDSDTV